MILPTFRPPALKVHYFSAKKLEKAQALELPQVYTFLAIYRASLFYNRIHIRLGNTTDWKSNQSQSMKIFFCVLDQSLMTARWIDELDRWIDELDRWIDGLMNWIDGLMDRIRLKSRIFCCQSNWCESFLRAWSWQMLASTKKPLLLNSLLFLHASLACHEGCPICCTVGFEVYRNFLPYPHHVLFCLESYIPSGPAIYNSETFFIILVWGIVLLLSFCVSNCFF